MKIGYIRVSTQEQNTIRQEILMERLGVDELYIDRASGKNAQRPELQKMMNYYLPTTSKLLDAYRELDKQPIAGENISNTKAEIEQTVDTLNVAFEKLLDSLFADRAWDISSDISVLNTMLAQEGLKEDDFTLNNK